LLGRLGWGDVKKSFLAYLNGLQRHEKNADNMLSISPHPTQSCWAIPAQHPAGKCKSDPVGLAPLERALKNKST